MVGVGNYSERAGQQKSEKACESPPAMPPVVRGCKEPLPVDLYGFIMKASDIGRIIGVVEIEEHDVRTDAHATLHVRIARRTSAAPLCLPALRIGALVSGTWRRPKKLKGKQVRSRWEATSRGRRLKPALPSPKIRLTPFPTTVTTHLCAMTYENFTSRGQRVCELGETAWETSGFSVVAAAALLR